jgi:serine/threonine-protein kinase SRPK3
MVKVRGSGGLINPSQLHFKIASPIDKDQDDQCQAAIVRAPEVTLGYTWSTPVDIWSVGCLVSFTQ